MPQGPVVNYFSQHMLINLKNKQSSASRAIWKINFSPEGQQKHNFSWKEQKSWNCCILQSKQELSNANFWKVEHMVMDIKQQQPSANQFKLPTDDLREKQNTVAKKKKIDPNRPILLKTTKSRSKPYRETPTTTISREVRTRVSFSATELKRSTSTSNPKLKWSRWTRWRRRPSRPTNQEPDSTIKIRFFPPQNS